MDKNSSSKYNSSDSECSNESSLNPHAMFKIEKFRFYLNFASQCSVIEDNSSVIFLAQTLGQKEPIKVQTFDWFG